MNIELQPRIDANRNLIGISNTFVKDLPPLAHAKEDLERAFLNIRELVYVPYAYGDMDKVVNILTPTFMEMGVKTVKSPHMYPHHEAEVIQDADVIFIGGGNTGRLVANLWALRNHDGSYVDQRPEASKSFLIDAIREKAAEGRAIIGSSAGFNVMCGDVRATNDMQAAVQRMADGIHVLRIDGLGLLPSNLSVNPHYQDKVVVTEDERNAILAVNPKLKILTDHQGESRAERLTQLLEMDNKRIALALREGSYIVVKGKEMEVKGKTGGLIFEYGKEPQIVENGDRLDRLLLQ